MTDDASELDETVVQTAAGILRDDEQQRNWLQAAAAQSKLTKRKARVTTTTTVAAHVVPFQAEAEGMAVYFALQLATAVQFCKMLEKLSKLASQCCWDVVPGEGLTVRAQDNCRVCAVSMHVPRSAFAAWHVSTAATAVVLATGVLGACAKAMKFDRLLTCGLASDQERLQWRVRPRAGPGKDEAFTLHANEPPPDLDAAFGATTLHAPHTPLIRATVAPADVKAGAAGVATVKAATVRLQVVQGAVTLQAGNGKYRMTMPAAETARVGGGGPTTTTTTTIKSAETEVSLHYLVIVLDLIAALGQDTVTMLLPDAGGPPLPLQVTAPMGKDGAHVCILLAQCEE